jgi:hypothetical protein
MLNCVFRWKDIDIIIEMKFFISDLHEQIKEYIQNQIFNFN